MPRVSCLIPIYNGEAFLKEALDSVLAQTMDDFEVIAVDDGSTDGTSEVLDAYRARDKRFKIFRKRNSGIVDTLNLGLAEASAPYIARMDADDVCMPQRFEVQAAYLDTHPECAIVGAQVRILSPGGELGEIVTAGHIDRSVTNLRVFPPKVAVTTHPVAMIRRDVLIGLRGYRNGFLHAEDHDLYLRVARYGSVVTLHKVLLNYRVHNQSVSQRNVVIQERHAALAELSAIEVSRGRPDPAETGPDLTPGAMDARLAATVPAPLLDSYVTFRVWRRIRSYDPAAAAPLRRLILSFLLRPAPDTLFDARFNGLRRRIIASMMLWRAQILRGWLRRRFGAGRRRTGLEGERSHAGTP